MAPSLIFIPELRSARSTGDEGDDNKNETSTSPTLSTDTPPGTNGTASSTDATTTVSSIMSSTTNGTLTAATGASSTPHRGGHSPEGTAVAVIITLILIGAFLIFVFIYMKRRGKLDKCFRPMTKKRRSSTSSSRRALGEEHDIIENMDPPRPREEGDEMFTIDDFEENPDPQEGKEEYYYDEVFGQSQFEDEATNNAMRHLYTASDSHPAEEEMLDFDFETLGIKIDDYKIESSRKGTM